ncbi:MAG: hypothetical protein J6T94_02345 [Bacteroidaceae bacterium]|nr:hypothetical protein [Bacteroidaceae bacterium]MBP5322406.1 hypothetical protein [Bacteroidaceae bacterium]
MADEFAVEDIDDDKTISFIRSYVSQELKEKLSDDALVFLLDSICDYYCDHGVFEQEPDENGYVDVDVEEVADYLVAESAKHQIGTFTRDEMIQVVNGELEYGDQMEEDI